MKNKKIWPVLFFLRSAQLMYWLKLTCKKASCKEATNFKSISLFWFVEFLFGRSKVTILSSKLDRFYNIAVSFFQFKIPSARSFTIISCKAAAFASFRVSFSYFVFFSFRSFRSFSVLWSRGFLIRRIIFRCVWYAIHANLLSLRLHSTDNDQSMILNTSFNIFVENEKDKRNCPYFRLKVIFPFLLLFFSFFFFLFLLGEFGSLISQWNSSCSIRLRYDACGAISYFPAHVLVRGTVAWKILVIPINYNNITNETVNVSHLPYEQSPDKWKFLATRSIVCRISLCVCTYI